MSLYATSFFPPDVCVYLEAYPKEKKKCEQAESGLEAIGVFLFLNYFVFIILASRQKKKKSPGFN